jgi:hypothetical protein
MFMMNLWEESMNTIKGNILVEILLDVSKTLDLELKADETKYTLTSRRQNQV